MAQIQGTNISAAVVPNDSADSYATHKDKYGEGGYRVVADHAERNAITLPRQKVGMVVFTQSDSKEWRLLTTATPLADVNFVEVTASASSGYVNPITISGNPQVSESAEYIAVGNSTAYTETANTLGFGLFAATSGETPYFYMVDANSLNKIKIAEGFNTEHQLPDFSGKLVVENGIDNITRVTALYANNSIAVIDVTNPVQYSYLDTTAIGVQDDTINSAVTINASNIALQGTRGGAIIYDNGSISLLRTNGNGLFQKTISLPININGNHTLILPNEDGTIATQEWANARFSTAGASGSFVDLTSTQNIGGIKTFLNDTTFSGSIRTNNSSSGFLELQRQTTVPSQPSAQKLRVWFENTTTGNGQVDLCWQASTVSRKLRTPTLTGNRVYTLPDKDIIVAGLDDISTTLSNYVAKSGSTMSGSLTAPAITSTGAIYAIDVNSTNVTATLDSLYLAYKENGGIAITDSAVYNCAILKVSNLTTTDRIFEFPDQSGTFALTNDLTALFDEVSAISTVADSRILLSYNSAAGGFGTGIGIFDTAVGQGIGFISSSNLTEDRILQLPNSDGVFLTTGINILPSFTNNSAAISGGLSVGQLYKTGTGEIRIVV